MKPNEMRRPACREFNLIEFLIIITIIAIFASMLLRCPDSPALTNKKKNRIWKLTECVESMAHIIGLIQLMKHGQPDRICCQERDLPLR